ncbi:next to BRCA1 gene 1 protein isoform X2 [Ascaphus truei]
MEAQVNLCVTYNGDTQSFLVSDSRNTTWADVEAMVLVSFDLTDIQIKYIDEDNEEVSVNTQEEYEEALKIAVKQGGLLEVNVYEKSQRPDPAPASRGKESRGEPAEPAEQVPAVRSGKRPLGHYSMLARAVGQEMQRGEAYNKMMEQNGPSVAKRTNGIPPDWFTTYMDTFKEQIVSETVEKVNQTLGDKLGRSQDWMSDSGSSSALQEPDRPASRSSLHDWLLACSTCQGRILGVRYQCSTCPSFSVCEQCEAGNCDHDSNHLFLKMRRPVVSSGEAFSTGQHPHPPTSTEQVRLQKHMDKTLVKAEKQRMRAEKKQRKAEVKELKKQLKLHRKIHVWSSLDTRSEETARQARPESPQSNALVIPLLPSSQIIPTLSAVFVDENLPDGTHLQPGTRFIKHWRMKNTGNVKWNSDTKLKFMWGNLTLASSSRKDTPVPSLLPGQVGAVSVEFIAPALEGTYTSHWRLAHKGEQFGPRVWCSIIVDSLPCPDNREDNGKGFVSGKEEVLYSSLLPPLTLCNLARLQEVSTGSIDQQLGEALEMVDLPTASTPVKIRSPHTDREMYIPSVDLLTAQDLLSFELLDINIVQELERVPHNTPVDMTPCMSPLPHDGPLIEKPGLGQIEEETEGNGHKALAGVSKGPERAESAAPQEEAEEDISGTQFVCETVMRSLTLDAAPDYNPPQKRTSAQSSLQSSPQTSFNYSVKSEESAIPKTSSVLSCPDLQGATGKDAVVNEKQSHAGAKPDLYGDGQEEDDLLDEIESQGSCDSTEDYIIVLPECFDTSRPIGESMYSSALSETGGDKESGTESAEDDGTGGGANLLQAHSINDILTTSQTLDAVPLTPEVLRPSPQLRMSQELQGPSMTVEEEAGAADVRSSVPAPSSRGPSTENLPRTDSSANPPTPREWFDTRAIPLTPLPLHSRHHRVGIAGGLVKGALSVAASAYKALFAGQPEMAQPPCSEDQAGAMMAILLEMGFCDRQLNQRLLRKHKYNLMDVVTELIQINDNDWYSARY